MTHNLNPLLLVCSSLYPGTTHGSSREHPLWTTWKGCCGVCRRLLMDGGGVFCGNFCYKRGPWKPCQQAWCGPCYTPTDNLGFPIALPTDEEGVTAMDPDDAKRFLQARNGDILVTLFQCDTCHFRNLMGRDPIANLAPDVRVLKLIRRANLDALWSRKPSTATGVLLTCRQGARVASSLGFGTALF